MAHELEVGGHLLEVHVAADCSEALGERRDILGGTVTRQAIVEPEVDAQRSEGVCGVLLFMPVQLGQPVSRLVGLQSQRRARCRLIQVVIVTSTEVGAAWDVLAGFRVAALTKDLVHVLGLKVWSDNRVEFFIGDRHCHVQVPCVDGGDLRDLRHSRQGC